ncbi:MAG: hypothetical protein ABH952_06120 [Candidatus Omnitrophota bacterium]
MWKIKQHIWFKAIAFVLIQAFFFMDISLSAGGSLGDLYVSLTPALKLDKDNLKQFFLSGFSINELDLQQVMVPADRESLLKFLQLNPKYAIQDEGGDILEVLGIYIPQEDTDLLNELPTKERERVNKQFPAVSRDFPQPFLLVRVTSKKEEPLAYLVLYPSPEGLSFIESKKTKYSPSVLYTRWRDLIVSLKPSQRKKGFYKKSFDQHINYAGGYYFRNNYLKVRKASLQVSDFDPNIISDEKWKKKVYFDKKTNMFTMTSYLNREELNELLHKIENAFLRIQIAALYYASRRGTLQAFIETIDQLKVEGDYNFLTEGNLEVILTRFGYPVQYISSHYKLYMHYQKLGIDIRVRFKELLAVSEGELDAFIKLMTELKAKDVYKLLKESNLQGVLTGFGYPVQYISSCYKIYTYWQDKGIDIVKEFDHLFIEGSMTKEIIDQLEVEVKSKSEGLPQGNFGLSLGAYIYFVLMGIGRIEKPPVHAIPLDDVGYKVSSNILPLDLTQLLLDQLVNNDGLTPEEYKVAFCIIEGYDESEIVTVLGIPPDRLSEVMISLGEKLVEHGIIRLRKTTQQPVQVTVAGRFLSGFSSDTFDGDNGNSQRRNHHNPELDELSGIGFDALEQRLARRTHERRGGGGAEVAAGSGGISDDDMEGTIEVIREGETFQFTSENYPIQHGQIEGFLKSYNRNGVISVDGFGEINLASEFREALESNSILLVKTQIPLFHIRTKSNTEYQFVYVDHEEVFGKKGAIYLSYIGMMNISDEELFSVIAYGLIKRKFGKAANEAAKKNQEQIAPTVQQTFNTNAQLDLSDMKTSEQVLNVLRQLAMVNCRQTQSRIISKERHLGFNIDAIINMIRFSKAPIELEHALVLAFGIFAGGGNNVDLYEEQLFAASVTAKNLTEFEQNLNALKNFQTEGRRVTKENKVSFSAYLDNSIYFIALPKLGSKDSESFTKMLNNIHAYFMELGRKEMTFSPAAKLELIIAALVSDDCDEFREALTFLSEIRLELIAGQQQGNWESKFLNRLREIDPDALSAVEDKARSFLIHHLENKAQDKRVSNIDWLIEYIFGFFIRLDPFYPTNELYETLVKFGLAELPIIKDTIIGDRSDPVIKEALFLPMLRIIDSMSEYERLKKELGLRQDLDFYHGLRNQAFRNLMYKENYCALQIASNIEEFIEIRNALEEFVKEITTSQYDPLSRSSRYRLDGLDDIYYELVIKVSESVEDAKEALVLLRTYKRYYNDHIGMDKMGRYVDSLISLTARVNNIEELRKAIGQYGSVLNRIGYGTVDNKPIQELRNIIAHTADPLLKATILTLAEYIEKNVILSEKKIKELLNRYRSVYQEAFDTPIAKIMLEEIQAIERAI